jgi:hypothetical protein
MAAPTARDGAALAPTEAAMMTTRSVTPRIATPRILLPRIAPDVRPRRIAPRAAPGLGVAGRARPHELAGGVVPPRGPSAGWRGVGLGVGGRATC